MLGFVCARSSGVEWKVGTAVVLDADGDVGGTCV